MDKYYKKFSQFLIKNGAINVVDKELYEYAIRIISQACISIIASILIGVVFIMVKECVAFLIAFLILRKFSGGIHARNFFCCLISSIVLIIVSLLLIRFFIMRSLSIFFLILMVISIIVIVKLSPIENENKKLSTRETRIFKITSIIIAFCLLGISVYLLWIENNIAYSLGMSIIATSFLMILAYIKIKFHLLIQYK